ncbi:hypothetical protein EIL87_13695 [Saccharopolyspora rhizosphaerae]|uniref:PPE domain-containing protein n=2 Tax=Saccharopolyspora rhizosphaerae TaxID=2492662 RepID=A0A426JT59_9PSEU|nr:hypothetical protein EIL87_13695 [Saccharopolyspora rhizosphaerae]
MVDDIADALRAAEVAHTGAAAEAAGASIAEIQPLARAAAETSRGVKDALEEQNTYQREAFQALPRQDDPLPSGHGAVLDPPQKGWVEDWGLDSNPVTGWMSDYEERQQAYVDTNQQANQVMERYSQQTEGVIARLPEFQPADQPPPAAPPASSYPTPGTHAGGDGGSSYSGGTYSSPAGTSSAWASAPAAPAVHAPSAPPAASNPAWATPAPSTPGLPPGVVRGPDGTLFRQNPQTGAWERQNPHNGRWAPSPHGGPGGRRAAEGAGAPVGRGAGGRPGMGGLGAAGGANGAGAAAGRGGPAGAPGAGAAGRGQQGESEEQEHQRPGWLVEQDDVFTNDMQRTAPAAFGDADRGR